VVQQELQASPVTLVFLVTQDFQVLLVILDVMGNLVVLHSITIMNLQFTQEMLLLDP
jgi:serine phosphatase RsbU (regulator of sigma subunit)